MFGLKSIIIELQEKSMIATWLSISTKFRRLSIGGTKMKMLDAEHPANQKVTPYVSRADFCRLFEQDMSRLYLLSFLLTADHETAVKCFVSGLEDCQKASTVFKEWTESWARRTIVQNAIRMIQPRPGRVEADRALSDAITGSAATASKSATTGLTTTDLTTTGLT